MAITIIPRGQTPPPTGGISVVPRGSTDLPPFIVISSPKNNSDIVIAQFQMNGFAQDTGDLSSIVGRIFKSTAPTTALHTLTATVIRISPTSVFWRINVSMASNVNGDYTGVLTARDSNGNIATAQVSMRLIAGQPPVITPPPAEAKSALYMPLYSPEISAVAVSANNQLVGFVNLFTANPNSGPASKASRPDIVQRLKDLRAGNPACVILGYIPTGYANTQQPGDPFYRPGGKSTSTALGWVDQWMEWTDLGGGVHGIDGIMEDEYLTTASALPYYRIMRDGIRQRFSAKGLTAIIRGNPGSPITDERHVSENLADIFSINENNEIPGESTLIARTFNGRYPKTRFNWLTHSRASSTWTDAQYRMLQKYCGSILITDRTFSQNPWSAAPDSMQRQINLIKTQPGNEQPPATGATTDGNGMQLPQPFAQENIILEYFNETSNFDANFRTDGRRYDFNGKRDSVLVAGYFYLPTSFSNDEVSAKMNGGPHSDSNPDWADTMDLGITNFTGTESRLRWEKTHPEYSGEMPPTTGQTVGECRGKWRGYIGMKVNLDLDKNGTYDHVGIVGMVDTGGIVNDKPANNWIITYKRIFTPDASVKSWFTPYVCTIGQCESAQNTLRIDNSPPTGMLDRFVTCKEIRQKVA